MHIPGQTSHYPYSKDRFIVTVKDAGQSEQIVDQINNIAGIKSAQVPRTRYLVVAIDDPQRLEELMEAVRHLEGVDKVAREGCSHMC